MIYAREITHFDADNAWLEEFLLFCTAVAGKTAYIIANQLEVFLNFVPDGTPFEKIRVMLDLDILEECLKESKIGQYTKLSKGFKQLVESNLDLKTCTVEDLEKIHGIGPKTARYFILHTRKNAEVAVLDTHILKYMLKMGFNVPKGTPSGKTYQTIEKLFIEHARGLKKNIAELDLEIWNSYARK